MLIYYVYSAYESWYHNCINKGGGGQVYIWDYTVIYPNLDL